jgi:hypothetical protein
LQDTGSRQIEKSLIAAMTHAYIIRMKDDQSGIG